MSEVVTEEDILRFADNTIRITRDMLRCEDFNGVRERLRTVTLAGFIYEDSLIMRASLSEPFIEFCQDTLDFSMEEMLEHDSRLIAQAKLIA